MWGFMKIVEERKGKKSRVPKLPRSLKFVGHDFVIAEDLLHNEDLYLDDSKCSRPVLSKSRDPTHE